MALVFERSPDTDAAISVLRGINDEISYADAAKRAGLGTPRFKCVLASARRALRSEGILFGVIRGEGLRRLTDQDKVKKPEAFKKRVMRGAGRELKDLSTIADFGALGKTDQHSVTLNRTILNAMRQSASVKPDKITPTASPQPMANVAVLASMKKKK
jgi:hypothetical protein